MEGLQKENIVYYMLIAVTVLSQTVVLLSRQRVNKDALGVLDIAFKMFNQLGIALPKPVLFIQTMMTQDGSQLTDGDRRPISKEELLDIIKQDIPIIDEFQVEFFRLNEVPDIEVLKDCTGMDEAHQIFQNATKRYNKDVRNLLERLKLVEDRVPAEQRMTYLIRLLDHLNDKNPDLVLEHLEVFEKDVKRVLQSMICQEREDLVSFHRNKPPMRGPDTTLDEFFEPPKKSLYAFFEDYCMNSPFMGREKDASAFVAKMNEVYEHSTYFTGTLKASETGTDKTIGIMSYVEPDFLAKKTTSSDVLKDVETILGNATDKDLFSDLPSSLPRDRVCELEGKSPQYSQY